MNDTIAAISTALGVGAISIIRISGEESIQITNKIFEGTDLTKVKSHTIHYGHIKNEREMIDEVLVTIMKAPKTFTREDVVEINCHGGIASTNKILETLLTSGCRLAEAGEFTKRAFLNGRIDLVNAESIMNVISAESDGARRVAMKGIDGYLSKKIKNIRQSLLQLLASIEVNIDYPEYEDAIDMTIQEIKPQIENISKDLKELINKSENGQILTTGIKTAIVGRPNVGKSSILNKLLNEEKAIVTDIEGTTRDTVEGKLNVGGVTLNIIDTAGIRKTNDIVEKLGVEKSLKLIEDATLIIAVLNNNEKLTNEDRLILDKIKDKKSIIVVNKSDLETKIEIEELNGKNIIYTNTVDLEGLKELEAKIEELFQLQQLKSEDYTYLSNARQISLAKIALEKLQEAENACRKEVPVDMIEIDIRSCWEKLGEIIGETYTEELLDQLFSQFCLGK